ncbi:hypothetical protein EYF80_038537 [Liparis tanakae]|uniref:Uncharacterized protein n=1 Tax=Liparis tanakae TaxID=230148 RepID=A0A4Z2GCH4_9TELE|nr:hypothetical protein EYF80_038537 [Liparis tanakae]
MMAEFGWLPRKMGIRVEMSSWRSVCHEVEICSNASTNMSGQCLIGKLNSCFTCSYCPTSESRSRLSTRSRLFLLRVEGNQSNTPSHHNSPKMLSSYLSLSVLPWPIDEIDREDLHAQPSLDAIHDYMQAFTVPDYKAGMVQFVRHLFEVQF